MALTNLSRAKVSNSYTPVLTDVGGSGTAPVLTRAFFSIDGNLVQVWGRMIVDPTATPVVEVGIDLPFPKAFAADSDCIGTVSGSLPAEFLTGFVKADTTNARAQLDAFFATPFGAQAIVFQFAYLQVG